jgi:hypothetical protein
MAHEHESVPFYLDGSLNAAVDLKPDQYAPPGESMNHEQGGLRWPRNRNKKATWTCRR